MHTNLHTIERLGSLAAGLALLSVGRRANGARLLQPAAVGLVVRGLSGYCPEDLRRLKQQFEAGEVPSVARLSARRGAKSESVSRPLEDASAPRAL